MTNATKELEIAIKLIKEVIELPSDIFKHKYPSKWIEYKLDEAIEYIVRAEELSRELEN